MKHSALLILPLLCWTNTAQAQDVDAAIKVFAAHCLAEGPRFDTTVRLAKQEEWPELATDMTMAFTPVEEPTAMQGWILSKAEDEAFRAIIVYKAKIADKPVEGCTAALSGIDANAFETALALRIKARPLGAEPGEDTVYKRYSANVAGRDGAITIAMPRYPKGSDQVIASVVAQELVEN